MPYADYAYYTGEYHGGMPEADFARLSRRACAYLDQVTFGRAESAPEGLRGKLKDACCAVADACLLNEQGGGVASESNDGVTVTYIAGTGKAKTDTERMYEAALTYLGMTGLMCRSVNI